MVWNVLSEAADFLVHKVVLPITDIITMSDREQIPLQTDGGDGAKNSSGTMKQPGTSSSSPTTASSSPLSNSRHSNPDNGGGGGKADNSEHDENDHLTYQAHKTPNASEDELDHDNDSDDEEETGSMSSSSPALQRLVIVAAITAATLGYDVGIMAAAIQPLEKEMGLSGFQKELAMGSLNFVAAIGALLGGHVANGKGRKPTVVLCCWIFVVGTLCMALAPTYGVLLAGRIITGIGVGVSFVVAPVYLAEVAPTHLRGQLNTVFDVAINGGILLGYVMGFLVQIIPGLPDSYKWRIMLGLGLVLPVAVLWNLVYLPESPRWLVMANQSERAGDVLKGLGQNQKHVFRTISSIEEELTYEQQDQQASAVPLGTLCNPFSWSHGMKLAVALGFWQQITGTEAVLYYSADFLERAGLESPTQRLLGNIFVGLCKLTPELVAMQLVDKLGRRPLILSSVVALFLSTASLALAFYVEAAPIVVVLLLCAIMASFSIGVGPFSFLVASESLGLSERATGMTLCAAANRCTSGSVALTAVTLYTAFGNSGLFALYALIGLISLPFYYVIVPETSGQSLEELAARSRMTSTNNSACNSVVSSPAINTRNRPPLSPVSETKQKLSTLPPDVEMPGGTLT